MNPHITFPAAAIALAERTRFYDRAEAIAREGLESVDAYLERWRGLYPTQAERDRSADFLRALMRDALGWVFFQSDRIEEAEAELLASYELNPASWLNLHHLGELYEYNGDRPSAERFYVQGMNVDTLAANPNQAALERLYERDRGSLQGFDQYLETIAAADAESRHEEILGSKLEELRAAPSFELATLKGGTIDLDNLRGRIVVINYWGLWCYWCLAEMEDVEALHRRYADDPDVVILTINNDSDIEEVIEWMTGREFTFPVLRDDGYVGGAGINAFPTTWFLDTEGRIVFEKTGWSQEVAQEFSWRVEAIREGSPPQ